MILIWNNVNSFRRHLEEMRLFRESHYDEPIEASKMLKNLPVLFDVQPPHETGLINSLTDDKGRLIIVPIQKITLHRGSQN
jgi:hypothetical protein